MSPTRRRLARADAIMELREWAQLLAERLRQLRGRIVAGDDTAWAEYLALAPPLATVLERVSAARRCALLTTKEMAQDAGVAPKTLLRRVARGELAPTVKRGKLIRWAGDELGGRPRPAAGSRTRG